MEIGAKPFGVIVKGKLAEVPPPGGGFNTVTLNVPGLLRSEAEITAVSVVLLTKVVGREPPFH